MIRLTARHSAPTARLYTAGSMTSAAFISTIFHVVLFGLTAFGLPFVAKDPLVMSRPVSVEFVEIGEITQATRQAPAQSAPDNSDVPAPPSSKDQAPQMTAEAPPDLARPAPPDIEKAKPVPPKPVPPPPKVAEKPDPPASKPAPEPEPPEETASVKKPEQQAKFQSLLRNLTPEAGTEAAASDAPDLNAQGETQTAMQAPLGERMTVAEADALRAQLAKCWNVMAGAKYAEDLVVEIRAEINPDRTVRRAVIVDQGRYNRDTHFRAAADAAMRALRNPVCSPLALPADKYEQWRYTLIRFDPREML